MKRREFLCLFGSAAVALPVIARAQQTNPLIGYLGSAGADEPRNIAFRRGLAEQGFVDGQNVRIEFLWAHGDYGRLPSMIDEFGRRGAAAIFASGNQAALAAKAANLSVPVIFAIGDDPVRLKLVESMNKPGGNVTGFSFYSVALLEKRLGLFQDLIPRDRTIAMISNPLSPNYQEQIVAARKAAQALGRAIEYLDAQTVDQLDAALATIVERRIGGFVYGTDPFLNLHRGRLVDFAARQRLPAVFSRREYSEIGAPISYGSNMFDSFRQGGVYVGRVLKGERPADLPVMQPNRFELIVNLKAASAIGFTVPPTLLALADEVIE